MEIDPLPNGNSAVNSASTTASPMVTAPSSNLTQLTESLKLEHQFVRVPFEHYKKTIRVNHRAVEKEISSVVSGVNEAAESDLSKDDVVQHLTSLVSRLQGLKRKLEESSRTENLQAQRCRARLNHLESADADNLTEWSNTRLKRILVDYMLRMSYYDTAMKLAESSNIQDLVDIDVFQEARRVIDALQNKEVAPALAWCADNRSRLKKSKSKFEFQLRLQEFIELVRADNHMRAIAYARKYLSPWGATHMKELQRVMATLAFKSATECATYKVLFEPKQWDYLVEQFKQEFFKLYGMTLEPLLNIYLQAGLSALKTPYCYEEDCPKEDPLSQESFRKLALPLPYSKQHHSKLVCYITKELMDTENPPQVLPNGYVYSTKALEEMAKKNNGKITCPRTGLVCNYSELVKAYIS
ncbi:Protein MAEA homolog [Linum grandiflorum]